jgi:hypothetical protein
VPSAEWRRSRTVNVHDELWDRIHRTYLAAAQASAEHVSKSEFLEEVFEAGLAVVSTRLGIRAAGAGTPRQDLATQEQPPAAALLAEAVPPAPSRPAPSPPMPRRRTTAEDRRAAAMERLRRQAAAPLHPPAIPTAAARPPEEEAAP